jgi:hypothetical protein
VAHIEDISFIGEQTIFDRKLSKSENDNYALGTSYNDYETEVIAGNTFDYPKLHGKAIKEAGYSFTSASHKAVTEEYISLTKYDIVDLILGKQRSTAIGRGTSGYHFEVLPEELQQPIKEYTKQGGALLLSGSYIFSDLWHSPTATDGDRAFAQETLHASFGGNMASRTGEVSMPSTKFSRKKLEITFNTTPSSEVYPVESPEVVLPVGKSAYTILRYTQTQQSAGVAYDGAYRSITLGFPFETITDGKTREELMKHIIKYLSNK